MFQPLDRASISNSVLQQIQRAMERGELRRGDQLPPEPELAEQLQVSRGSLREALKVLQVLGILEVRRGSGTFIAEHPRLPTVDPLLFLLLLQDGTTSHLIELRFMVEVGFTRLAQPRISDRDLARLEDSIRAMRGAIDDGTIGAEHDLAFHRIILEATENPFVIQVGTTVLELFRESIGRGVRTFPTYAAQHHEAILEALRSRDPARVEPAIRSSYEVWKALVKED